MDSTAWVERSDWAKTRGISILFASVGVYVVLVPTLSFIPALEPYNEKRVLQIGVLIAVAVSLLSWRSARQQWLSTFYELPHVARLGLCGVLGLGILSSALAPAPFYAFLEVGHFVLLFVAAGGVASEVRYAPRSAQRALLSIVAVSAGLYAVYFAVGYGAHLAIPGIKPWPDGGTNYANIRFFNQYQTWTLPLLGGIVLAIPSRWRVARVIAFGLVVLWWTFVFASVVRGTLVAVFVAFGIVGLLFKWRAVRFLGVQGAGVVLGFGLYLLLFSSGNGGSAAFTEDIGRTQSVIGRLEHWQICLEMAVSNPVFGAGPMHYAWPPVNFLPAASPHSAFMQWLGEWGIPSTILMSGLTVWGGWRWMQQERAAAVFADSRSNAVRIALVASVLAGAAHAQVSGLLVAPVSQVLLVLVGGWAWGRYRHRGSSPAVPSTSAHVILCVLLIAAMAVVGGRSVYDLSVADERQSAFSEAVDRRYYSPRYWMQGYLQVRDSSVVERARREMR